jgi:hypothetical protein
MQYHEVAGRIMKISEYAFLFKIDNNSIWIPFSQILEEKHELSLGEQTVSVKDWLCKKEGLHG